MTARADQGHDEQEQRRILMDRERQPLYDGLTTGRFGFSDFEGGEPAGDGIDIAHVDHPTRWARRYRQLHNMGGDR